MGIFPVRIFLYTKINNDIIHNFEMQKEEIHIMLRMLHQFKLIVESGNISKAAKVLNISQPALSKSIKTLESHFEVPLLKREVWGVSPTDFGDKLYMHVCLIDKEIENAESAIKSMWEASTLNLSVGIGTFWNYIYFPDAIIQLQTEFPNLRIAVKSGSPVELQTQILSGKIDLAIGRMPAETSPELIYQNMITVTKAVFAHENHPLFTRKQVTPEQLYEYPWVLFQLDEYRALLDGFDLMKAHSFIKTQSLSIARKVIAETQALTVLPNILTPVMGEYNIRIIPGDHQGKSYTTSVYYHKSALLKPAVKRLIDLISQIVPNKIQ